MLHLHNRIKALSQLGEAILALDGKVLESLSGNAQNQNPWFTQQSVKTSFAGIANLLNDQALSQWVGNYNWPQDSSPKTIGLVLAGNIPLVGFHDVLSVLISGNTAQIKQSSRDSILLPFVVDLLLSIEPGFSSHIQWVDQLKDFDAVIATGSDNSARYFEYYFGRYPSVIRKNRTSCAILTGNESREELSLLGLDVFTYFGLGCRNVSKIFVPEGFDLTNLLDCWEMFSDSMHHHKYFNNYEYQKAIMMINNTDHLDNGFVLMSQSEKLVSPIAVVFYDYYSTQKELTDKLNIFTDKIQCIVGKTDPATIPFGKAQIPGPSDYPDNADIIDFLLRLN